MKPNTPQSRRRFLKTSALATAATALSATRVPGANDQVRIALVGMGWKGGSHLKVFGGLDGVTIATVCDPDTDLMQQSADALGELNLPPADQVRDFREILDRKDIDAVVLATPNHWHALQTIWACQAGKDVYVEKPHAYNVWEGRKMIEAAARYDRIVQVGLQRRSDGGLAAAADWIREGHIGKIKSVRAIQCKPREGIGKRSTPLTPPPSVDYDLWLGPARDQPIYRDKLHYDWHWDWNTGNGEMGNIGTHAVDVARNFLGDPAPPKTVMSFGNRFAWDDAGNTPNVHVAAFGYDVPLVLELNCLKLSPGEGRRMTYHKTGAGVVVTCEGGEYRGFGSGKAYDLEGNTIQSFSGSNNVPDHAQNFIDAVRNHRAGDLNCEIQVGHASCSPPLLGGAAWRAGAPMQPGELETQIAGIPELEEIFARYSEQLRNWNIDFKKSPWIASPKLAYDADTETFTGPGGDKATAFLRRPEYRAPFVVPDTV